MRILITGGAGCLGSNLTERYLALGHEVVVIDNLATGHRESLPETLLGLRFLEASVADREVVERAFSEFRPTHVIHAAAAYKNPDDWCEDARTNIQGTINVIESAKIWNPIRIINLHTALGYGRPDRIPVPVDAPVRPFTSYGISKQAAENYLAISGLPFVSFRLANVTGPRLAIGPIPTFYTRLKGGKSCFCTRAMRDFIDMEDFFTLMDRALASDGPEGIYNISTGTGHWISEVFKIVVDHLNVRPSEPVAEIDPPSDDVAVMVLDPSVTMHRFGWSPEYTFDQTIRRMLKWYDANGVTAIYSHLRTHQPGEIHP